MLTSFNMKWQIAVGGLLLVAVLTASVSLNSQTEQLFGGLSNERIVGGSEAVSHSFPWIIDVRRGGHFCGGSLISQEWVVTSAHCSTAAPSNYFLVAGDHDITENNPEQQNREVDRIVIHPNYGTGSQFQYDIALMHVSIPFELNKNVEVINLSTESATVTGGDLTAAGWGATVENGSSVARLRRVDLPFVSDVDCRAVYGQTAITDDMLCAGEEGKDTCAGDSGGPLNCTINGNNTLCGISSWGRGCARPQYPGVYTEVSYFYKWINGTINLPPEEDNSTWVEQNEGCGGALFGSSGQVSYKLNEDFGANEKCTWSLRTNDVANIRVEVKELGNSGDRLYLTELDNLNGQLNRTISINATGNYNVTGPNVFLTLESDDDFLGNEGFRLHFYGFGNPQATGRKLSNHFSRNMSGIFRYPITDVDYSPDELVTIVLNPEASTTLSIDSIDLESSSSCSFDWLNVYTHMNGAFKFNSSNCGTTTPTPIPSDGPSILIFMSDHSVQGSGFNISWS